VSDLLQYSDDGQPCGLRDRETLAPHEELRLVRFQCKVHKSAKAGRAGVRWIDVELVSPLDLLRELSRLRGWSQESPTFQVLLQSIEAPRTVGAQHGAGFAIAHSLAETLLSGAALDSYLVAHASGDTATMAALLKEGAAELRACAQALPVEPRVAIHAPGCAPRAIPETVEAMLS
jgi:hypothetical protein